LRFNPGGLFFHGAKMKFQFEHDREANKLLLILKPETPEEKALASVFELHQGDGGGGLEAIVMLNEDEE
jgi:hypothetical protein